MISGFFYFFAVPKCWLFCQQADIYQKHPPFYLFSEEVALSMQIEKNIAATLQRKMDAAGKTKLEFSKELGIPRSTFQGYLKGDKALRSAGALHVRADIASLDPPCFPGGRDLSCRILYRISGRMSSGFYWKMEKKGISKNGGGCLAEDFQI